METILTADFVSLTASVILYVLAIGPIRGFALTLGLATIFDLIFTRFSLRMQFLYLLSFRQYTIIFPIKKEVLSNV